MQGWKVIRRKELLGWSSFLFFAVALLFSLAICCGLLYAQGKDGLQGMVLLLEGGFAHLYSIEDTLLKAVPIFLCSLGVAVCFRMRVWNIGAEGQFALGAIGSTAFVVWFPGAPLYIMLPGMLLGGILGGIFWAAIPALLRLRFGMNEIISSLMLNYIGMYLIEYLVYGPWMDPNGGGMPETFSFPAAAVVPQLFGDSFGFLAEHFGRLHWGLVVCLVMAIFLSFFFKRTLYGYEIMAAGENPRAARYAGIPYGWLVVMVFCLCGALAGIAGGMETSVTVNRLRPSILVGYGYTAIVVAWLAQLRIPRIFFFSFLLAGLRVGVENLQLDMQIPAAFGGVIEGCILLTVLAVQFFDRYTFQRKKRERPDLAQLPGSKRLGADPATAGEKNDL